MANAPRILTPGYDTDEVTPVHALIDSRGPYMEFGEFLQLEATSTDASATLRFNGKFLSTDGEIRSFNEDMVITGTGAQTAVTSRIGPCWLMGFAVRVVAGTITDGEIVASVHVVRAGASVPTHVMTLASGEVTNTRALGMGAFTVRGPDTVSTAAPVIPTASSSPAAGVNPTFTVTAGQVWEIQSLSFLFTTAVAVAVRRLVLEITNGTDTITSEAYPLTQAASLANYYSFFRNGE